MTRAVHVALLATACAPLLGIDDVGLEGPASLLVEGGQFTMGCGDGGAGCDGDEQTHFVTLAAFEIDETEVTRAQYRRCVEAGVCQEPSCDNDPMQGTHPVVCVRWIDAETYCERLGKRLPTEAEWEKAARWVDGRPYPWGTDAPTCAHANFSGCSTGADRVASHPEGRSVYGAVDMAGNVWEWVGDWYDANYYVVSPADNPVGPPPTGVRVIRGGAWASGPAVIRTSNRESAPEAGADATRGFRCAR